MATITDQILRPTGTPWANAVLRFDLLQVLPNADGTHPPASVTIRTDAEGKFTEELATAMTGATRYSVALPSGTSHTVFITPGEHTLRALLAAAAVKIPAPAVQEAIELHNRDITAHKELFDNLRAVDATYEHEQIEPATVWVINHNLGKRPAITVHDSAGVRGFMTEEWVDENTTILRAGAPLSGIASCS